MPAVQGICLCMIVCDEETNLELCLRSCRNYVDDVVVVDTGSQDASRDLAAQWGARVFTALWQDHFAEARNVSLACAEHEWILILDADEELPTETAQKLTHLLGQDRVDAWNFIICSPLSGSAHRQVVKHRSVRLFRNRPTYRFEGRIHEQIAPVIKGQGGIIENTDLIIRHHGYRQDREGRSHKTQRNICLLQRALAEQPDNGYYLYQLGVSLHRSGQPRQAEPVYEKAVKHTAAEYPSLFRDYAICLSELGQLDKALQTVQTGLVHFPDYADLYYIQGLIYYDCGFIQWARWSFAQCLRFQTVSPDYVTIEGINSFLALENLAEMCELMNEGESAQQYTQQALAISPSLPLWKRCGRLWNKAGKPGKRFREYLQAESGLSPQDMAAVLFAGGYYRECLHLINQSPPHPLGMLLYIDCLQRLGEGCPDLEERLEHYGQSPQAPMLIQRACLYLWQQQPRGNAAYLLYRMNHMHIPILRAALEINQRLFIPAHISPSVEKGLVLELALGLLEYDDPDLAVQICHFMIPYHQRPAALLARAALQRGMYRYAIDLFEQLPAGEDQNEEGLADAYLHGGDFSKAFLAYTRLASRRSSPLIKARVIETMAASLHRLLLKYAREEHYSPLVIRHMIHLASTEKTWHYQAERLRED